MFFNDYYVYLLLDPRKFFAPFYVGKGRGERWKTHLQKSSQGENKHKDAIINKIVSEGLSVSCIKWAEELNEEQAYSLEESLIRRFGRKGIDSNGLLTNVCTSVKPPKTKGPRSQATKDRISQAQLGEKNHRYNKTFTEEQRNARSALFKELGFKPPTRTGPMSQDQKDAISKGNKGKIKSSEHRQKISETLTGRKTRPCSEETKEKIRKSNLGKKKRPRTPEEKEQARVRMKAIWDAKGPYERSVHADLVSSGKERKKPPE